jgi:hypothetical protein
MFPTKSMTYLGPQSGRASVTDWFLVNSASWHCRFLQSRCSGYATTIMWSPETRLWKQGEHEVGNEAGEAQYEMLTISLKPTRETERKSFFRFTFANAEESRQFTLTTYSDRLVSLLLTRLTRDFLRRGRRDRSLPFSQLQSVPEGVILSATLSLRQC